MTVKAILQEKGREVITLGPDATIGAAAKVLAENRIGALVVTKGGGRIAGILSERDVVRAVAAEGAAALDRPLSSAMTARVMTCGEHHTVHDVMEIMTRGRFRHLPVEEAGKLAGIVSIGDVVKRRIQEVEREAEDIKAYIATV
jgi:CBS domain-containing protein